MSWAVAILAASGIAAFLAGAFFLVRVAIAYERVKHFIDALPKDTPND